jgi:PQQ-like domain
MPPPPDVPVSAPPRVTGSALQPLWQGAPWDVFTVSDGLVIGNTSIAHHNDVIAVSALTGRGVWAVPMPRSLTVVLGFVPGTTTAGATVPAARVPAGGISDYPVGVIEAGNDFGQAPAMVAPGATTEIAVDMATGQRLWTAPLSGASQIPPIAVAGNEVLTGSTAGVITARNAQTGRILWTRPEPAGCGKLLVNGQVDAGMAIAADGTLVAASYQCSNGRDVVQRIGLSTGAIAWRWSSPPPAGSGALADLSLAGVAATGDVVLLSGQDTPSATPLVRVVAHTYYSPPVMGPQLYNEVVLALDAANGHPRWVEIGAQLEDLLLTDGAVCEVVNIGLECRDDVTGTPTRPALSNGQGAGATPPYIHDGWAGITGSLAAVTVAPFRDGRVTVELVPVRGRRPLGRAVVDVGVSAHGANYQTYVIGAGTLPGGGTVVLLRRLDRPGYPLVALRVASGLFTAANVRQSGLPETVAEHGRTGS